VSKKLDMKTKTPKKPTTSRRRKLSDKEQYERFRQSARELGTDESEEAFDRAFKKVMPPNPGRQSIQSAFETRHRKENKEDQSDS
jgi:hypothetical protein